MRVIDIIEKNKNKIELTEEEITWFIDEYVKGNIPDYQVSAWLMAVNFNSLTKKETYYLTKAMLNSGDKIDLSSIKGIKVDKHSTGGVGDKASLVVGPLAAACGCVMAKLSGRGLGHTGGTLDKLESIPGVTISLSEERFLNQVNTVHLAIAGQTQNLVPADKKLYALRDVTGTIKSIPLIASSIMSKKLASGADVICLDVKFGSGAFMKTTDEAIELSNEMISLANQAGKKAVCFITDMESPLGKAIGNRLEVLEAINCLKGKGPKDLENICTEIVSYMVFVSGIRNSKEEAKKLVYEKLRDGSAYNKFLEFINAQGATTNTFDESFVSCKEIIPLLSKKEGYIAKIDALTLGLVSMRLGAGRETKEDSIDPNVGIVLNHQCNEYVKVGEPLLYIYKNDKWDENIISDLYNAYSFSDKPIKEFKTIYKII